MSIDIGLSAIVRAVSNSPGETNISESNPANASGKIKRILIYARYEFTGLKVATFYSEGGADHFTTRDYQVITTGVVTAGYHSYIVDIDVVTGDFIGYYTTSGSSTYGTLYAGQASGLGRWQVSADKIPCSAALFGHYPTSAWGLISLYGDDVVITLATVTTQAVTDITYNSATGNGNITALGGENAQKRGFCWNKTGSPTVADDKVEETGSFGTGSFTGSLTDLDYNTTYYVKAYSFNAAGYSYGAEVNFITDKVSPTVTTQDATEVSQNHVKGNGNITASGGENATERGFEYGLTKTATWTKKETGSYEAGAFYLTIDGLQANTEYWYRAYAVNSIGTGYGEWVQFKTSASGTIPLGTKISICSDNSGYTFKLNSALTDDGESYQSFFVLSTDLAQKQGLHIYKRLEDLYSYFMKKGSGTAKIYIKRDSEAEWQYCGQISMMGDEDIIVKHLPSENQDTSGDVDWLAKHFLIKFVFENDFEFIGLITEAVPIGAR